MQATYELTEGQSRLQHIINEFPPDSPHWNEAQNRFQFVDRLLTECLGWEKPNIEVESFDDLGGRSDYLLGSPPKAVLETKREVLRFEVPPIAKPAVTRKLAPLLSSSKPFSDAVCQVIPYCAIRGAQIAIVCNGPQLAIFQAIVPGHSPLEGECYFFDGFNSYIDKFSTLWKLLSPEGITENCAYRDLALYRTPRIPEKGSASIAEPNKYRYRSTFQENLRSLSSLLLEEIEDNPDLKASFYEECYVPIQANNRHLLQSKNIIEARYRRGSGDGIAPEQLDTVTSVSNGNVTFSQPAIEVTGSRPIVVIGDVGVGKTSFFENLFQKLDATDKANTYFIQIDLGTKATLSDNIKSYVLTEIPRILKSTYGVDIEAADFVNAIYFGDLADFDKSVKGMWKGVDDIAYQRERIAFLAEKINHRDRHLHASLGHLANGRNKKIVLILDNADQRSFDVQQEAFMIAQELAASRSLIVFVALRPSTFYLSKTNGALSAYQNKVLTIAPPPADEVVQKRLIFAARVAEGSVAPATLAGIRLNLGNVVLFLRATLRSIRASEKIRLFLSNITGGNTRAVIELITGFFGSPNVDSEKIVRVESASNSYQIPLHEFTKHALLGEYAYFNSQSSLVACNIFDVKMADPREHFLCSFIIAFLNSNLGILNNDGFVHGNEILNEIRSYGFVEEQIRFALRRLAKKRLIETPQAHYREIQVEDHEPPEQFHFRATSVGIYHLRFWTGSFAFLDAVCTDTPIFDEATRSVVAKLASSFAIGDRYNRANAFRKYLENQWYLANFGCAYYDFVALLNSQDDTFLSVKQAAERRN